MSTVARKEYQETKIMRTVSPVRNFRSSTQNLAEFDHNLDNMLEDLQNSVSRPGSALGQPITNTRSTTLETIRNNNTNNNTLNRYNNVKSSNPVTEYSSDDAYDYTSPDGTKRIAGYKKESYSYRTDGGIGSTQARTQNSINQLDSLLDDLQQVKNSTFTDNSYNSTGLDPDFQGNKRTVQRELHYGDTPRSSSRTRTLERTERESSLTRDVQYRQEGTYGDIRPIRSISPTPSSRTSTLSKQTKVANIHQYPVAVVETTAPEISQEVLAHLDPSLHPPGNTKVTTTIKTYEYEIPGSGPYPTNLDKTIDTENYVYSPNQSQTTPSKSFIYNKYENKENTQINYQQHQPPPPPPPQETRWENRIYRESTDKTTSTNYQPYQKPPPPVPAGHSVVKETITTRNYQPGYQPDIPVNNNQTYVYNETVTTRNINNDNYHRPHPPVQQLPPPRPDTYIIEEKHNTVTNRNIINPPYPDNNNRLPYHQPSNDNKTVIYRHDSHTTNNNNYGPGYGDGDGNRGQPLNDVEIFDPRNVPPPAGGRKPNEPNVNIQYKYKSETRTTNNYKTGYPPSEETQNLLPRPFPTDSHPQPSNGGPPKRLDELMANIGNEPPNSPYNASFNAHEHELEQKKKIDTLKQQQADIVDNEVQRKQPVQHSKNVSGPPVYYPPNHEMFAKKEEGGAWRAEGAYARESGKYQYEAESKSKSKSSSGAAVIPVCLPLCCGLPCTII